MSEFSPIAEAVEAFARGEFLVVMDDESRENEGDLIIAAEHATTEKMAFLVRHSSGYVCAPLTNARAEELGLTYMVPNRSDKQGTAYTITVDFRDGTTTGISAHDRGLTCRMLADGSAGGDDFMKPGHVLPLRAVDGGVLQRRGHTEAAVDLCKLAKLAPVGVICEIVRDEDGLMARTDDCVAFGKKHGLKVITIDALVEYIKATAA
ncbi:3,4-dihydroxy-2-butanone 4-phosphate synthase [Dipodascopsis tothii]|uniref:3,4-dihydroxy-2-butanone 4-phosphate synthase n=1 Tax=Dipodascopsis tothii TaxID=44089 RepID=UPI0034CFF86B